MKIVLVCPEIPQNTGNIVRTCAVTGASLVLVKPLGFKISDRYLKRAGLDYWNLVNVEVIDDLEAFLDNTSSPFYFFSSKASKLYTTPKYTGDSLLIFGSETAGLPKRYWERWEEKFYTIAQRDGPRCLNLSNAASIVLYEAWRQQGFVTT